MIDGELHRLDISVAVQKEIKNQDSRSLKDNRSTFFRQGNNAELLSVEFAVRNNLLNMKESPTGDRLKEIHHCTNN